MPIAWMPYLVAFVFGSFIGSFLNVCAHRLPRNESVVSPGSRCCSCGTRLQWYDNLPLVSWPLQRGRCRWCGSRFGIRYWLMEVATGLLTALVCWGVFRSPAQFASPALPAAWWATAAAGAVVVLFAYAALVGSLVDLLYMIIPDEISLPLLLFGPTAVLLTRVGLHPGWEPGWFAAGGGFDPRGLADLLLVAVPVMAALVLSLPLARWIYTRCVPAEQRWEEKDFRGLRVSTWFFLAGLVPPLVVAAVASRLAAAPVDAAAGLCMAAAQAVLGGLAAWCLLYGAGLVGTLVFRRAAMGFGDVKFFAPFGCLIGPEGVLMAFFLAAVAACLISVPLKLLAAERELPFGPYLALGSLLALFFGGAIHAHFVSVLAPAL